MGIIIGIRGSGGGMSAEQAAQKIQENLLDQINGEDIDADYELIADQINGEII